MRKHLSQAVHWGGEGGVQVCLEGFPEKVVSDVSLEE